MAQVIPTEEAVAFVGAPDALQGVDGPPSPKEADERLQPMVARQTRPDASSAPQTANAKDVYRRTDFSGLRAAIDPSAFYDPSYNGTLDALIGQVLENEAPISETLLVQRIARAHGFQRAGRLIRDRVMKLVGHRHHRSEKDAEPFVWLDVDQRQGWTIARRPGSDEDIRQIEEIAVEELRAALHLGDPVNVARYFGVRRLSSTARARILSLASAHPLSELPV